MSDQVWFYLKKDKQFGPMAASELVKLLRTAKIDAGTLVWREGFANWQALKDVPSLASAIEHIAVPQKYRTGVQEEVRSHRTLDRCVTAAMFIVPFALVIVGLYFFSGYITGMTSDGPGKRTLTKHYLNLPEEDLPGGMPIGQWIPVDVYGGQRGSYEIRITKLSISKDSSYVAKGDHQIPDGTAVTVWEVHRIIERRDTGDGLFGSPAYEEKEVLVSAWRKTRESQGKYWEPVGYRETPLPVHR